MTSSTRHCVWEVHPRRLFHSRSFSWFYCLTLCDCIKIIFVLFIVDEHVGSFQFEDITNSCHRHSCMRRLVTSCTHFFWAHTYKWNCWSEIVGSWDMHLKCFFNELSTVWTEKVNMSDGLSAGSNVLKKRGSGLEYFGNKDDGKTVH